MGVAVYCERAGEEKLYHVVAGANEIRELWMPIVQARGLYAIEHAFNCGLSLHRALLDQVLEELAIMLAELEARVPFEDDCINPVYRCRRLCDLLKKHPPEEGYEIYIG